MAEFEQCRTGIEGRNKTIIAFTSSLAEFLARFKAELVNKLNNFNESEGKRVPLGPVMPAGNVTIEAFGTLADALTNGCIALMKDAGRHWQRVGEASVQEQARTLEIYLTKSTSKAI